MTSLETSRLTVAICDTQPVVIEGIQAALEKSECFRLLEPSRNLESLTHVIVTRAPRIALVDKALGIAEVTEWLGRVRMYGHTSVVVSGPNFREREAVRLLQSGAKGVWRKTARLEVLFSCLDAVCNGETWMDDNLFLSAGGYGSFGRTDLTSREQQVLQLVEQGMRNKDIARELGIRPGTVKIHLKHIFEKSGVRGRFGLALSGLRERYAPETLSA